MMYYVKKSRKYSTSTTLSVFAVFSACATCTQVRGSKQKSSVAKEGVDLVGVGGGGGGCGGVTIYIHIYYYTYR